MNDPFVVASALLWRHTFEHFNLWVRLIWLPITVIVNSGIDNGVNPLGNRHFFP